MKPLLAELATRLAKHKIAQPAPPKLLAKKAPVDHAAKEITQSWLWTEMAKFIQPNDVVLAETGTTSFGILYERLPASVK
jgi:pyruvate decarboxylase